MRSYRMQEVARQMNDLYEELKEVHQFNDLTAGEFVKSYFQGGYNK